VAALAVVALGYGVIYAVAVLRGAQWRHHVRQGNIAMALVVMALSALWLTPLLNAERISANSQFARFADGRTPVGQLDLFVLDQWGRAGDEMLEAVRALAAAPEQGALRARLAEYDAGIAVVGDLALTEDPAALLADLLAAMPVQPAGATATRDMLLKAIPSIELQSWIDACRSPLPGTERPGCVFVVADLWTDEPGEEALVLLREPAGFMRYEGLAMKDGELQRRSVAAIRGILPDLAEGEALIAALQDTPVALFPAPLNALGVAGGIVLLP